MHFFQRTYHHYYCCYNYYCCYYYYYYYCCCCCCCCCYYYNDVCMSVSVWLLGSSKGSVYSQWFSLNKTSGQLMLTRPLSLTTTSSSSSSSSSSLDLVLKVTDDCWSGYWERQQMTSSPVTWSPSDPSLLLVRVTVVMATRFSVTSLYAGLVTQAQAGHDVIELAVIYLPNYFILIFFSLCLYCSALEDFLTLCATWICVLLILAYFLWDDMCADVPLETTHLVFARRP